MVLALEVRRTTSERKIEKRTSGKEKDAGVTGAATPRRVLDRSNQ